MKKLYKIVTLLALFIFLTTYSPSELNIFPKKKNIFFRIQNIEVINNHLINKDIIVKKLLKIYEKNILFVKRSDIERPLKKINFLESGQIFRFW